MCKRTLIILCSALMMTACSKRASEAPIVLMTLDPGHFHAALVQKTMYPQVSPVVYVYAPKGQELDDHLKRIESYNKRAQDPTRWQERVYTGADFLERMTAEKPGNVVVISGNNRRKTEYIKASVDAGLHVLADKPMCIDRKGFELLLDAFAVADGKNVLLYDIMTERFEITTVLQKRLSAVPSVFGELLQGSAEEPAITKESVHHFYKMVSGAPLKRPAWFFDTAQQGEGIVDVSTHLVDLVQWECFPEQIIDYQKDIAIVSARRRPTVLSKEQFAKATLLDEWPDYLLPYVKNDLLYVYSNGEFVYRLKGVYAKVSVVWNFEAPAGGGDTHFSIMRGSKADLIIRQGKEEAYRPELYVRPKVSPSDFAAALEAAVAELAKEYPDISLMQLNDEWRIVIPDRYRIGHEAHFAQVTQNFLNYLQQGKLPDWEVPNMIAKYYTTTAALEKALEEMK